MSFFKKLKNKLFKTSSKLEEGIDAIVEDGGIEETVEAIEPPVAAVSEGPSAEEIAREAERARLEALAQEKAQTEERQRLEEARLEEARLEQERLENERLEQERLEAARVEAERLELEAERVEAARIENERLEAERLEQERIEKARLEAERLEMERAETARQDAERLAKEREAAARAAAETEALEEAEAARLRAELEAAERERARLEQERAEAEQARIEHERQEAARLEQERVEAERLEAARLEKERLEQERLVQERLERERLAAEKAEEERLAQEQARLEAEEAARVRAAEETAAAQTRIAEEDAVSQAAAALAAAEPVKPEKKPGIFGRLLGRKEPTTVIRRALDDDMLEALEELLIASDMGVDTALRVTANMAEGRMGKKLSTGEIKDLLASEIAAIMEPVAKPMPLYPNRPQVVLVVGVNGSGKTTTIGKLALQFQNAGKKVVIAAGDTFRAAAVEQLQVWGDRAGVPVLTAPEGSDPASLAFEAMTKAEADGADLLMIDTAGRLQNRADLMEELAKIVRVIRKKDPTAPHNTLLVLDATTGQNALNQVDIFRQIADVSGLVMTKLDGTAKGGVLVALADKFGLPIHAIGVGEQIDDLDAFDPTEFAQALTGIAVE
jgi:fused signal recognition particle receptor